MADNGQQPVTIMVKKADGTMERKTLDEIIALQNKAPVQPRPQTKPQTHAPASAPKVMPASMRAVLHEAIKNQSAPQPKTNQPPDNMVEEIIKKISFTLPSTAANRLRTLIQLALKNDRSPEQVNETILRAEDEGGVGLTDEQAREVMKLLPSKQKQPTQKPLTPQTSPQKPRPIQPATINPAPINPAPINPVKKEQAISTFIKAVPEEPYLKLPAETTTPPTKTVMRDITAKPMQIGPIDEIRALTLTDFRRLSSNPEEGAMRLKQKFLNVKDESILLYMEAVDVWKKSPLYADYVQAVIGNLAAKRALSTLTDAKTIRFEEIKALVAMEQQLLYI